MTRAGMRTAAAFVKPVALGLAVAVAVAAPWSVLAVANWRLSPRVPWALPAGLAYVGFAIAYLDGRGWPGATSEARRRDFRVRSHGVVEFAWALLAGLAAVTSLWLLYIASGHLATPAPALLRPELTPVFRVGAVVIGAAVTAIAEEGGLRGFAQAPLERLVGPLPAIATSSVLFVLIHLSHGVAIVTRNGPFYLAAGCVYGLLAYLTQSILPSLLLHFLGDVLSFGLQSSLVHLSGPREAGAKGALVVSAILLACAAGAAFFRLARLTRGKRPGLPTEEAAD